MSRILTGGANDKEKMRAAASSRIPRARNSAVRRKSGGSTQRYCGLTFGLGVAWVQPVARFATVPAVRADLKAHSMADGNQLQIAL